MRPMRETKASKKISQKVWFNTCLPWFKSYQFVFIGTKYFGKSLCYFGLEEAVSQ